MRKLFPVVVFATFAWECFRGCSSSSPPVRGVTQSTPRLIPWPWPRHSESPRVVCWRGVDTRHYSDHHCRSNAGGLPQCQTGDANGDKTATAAANDPNRNTATNRSPTQTDRVPVTSAIDATEDCTALFDSGDQDADSRLAQTQSRELRLRPRHDLPACLRPTRSGARAVLICATTSRDP